MFATERQAHIARVVEELGRARVVDLARRFAVSEVTIRKDLVELQAAGRLVRAHGGAILAERSHPERPFEIRERLQAAEKRAIGARALALVRDGESIALDASTTALRLALAIKARGAWSNLTIVTNGLRIATELAGSPGITVTMPGGRVRPEALSLVGGMGDGVLRRVNIQTAFLGASGFSLAAGLSDATDEEARLKRSIVAVASEVVAIVDSTKWGTNAFATFCPIERVSRVISDDAAPAEMVAALAARGIETSLAAVELPAGRDG